MKTQKYTIDRWNGAAWVWAGDGDTDDGTTAELPEVVYDFADAGKQGVLKADGAKYRVRHI